MVENRYIAHTAAAVSSMIGLGLTLHFMGQSRESDQIAQGLLDFAVETKDPDNLVLAQSGQARIGLLRGDSESIRPSQEAATMATAFIFLETAPITRCRLRVARGSGEGGAQAIAMIERLQKETEAIHNTYHLIDLMVLKAMALYRDDRLDDAEKCMEHALDLAAPGGWVRPFVELGPPMAELLTRMKQRYPAVDQVVTLLTAFRDLPVTSQPQVQQPKSRPDQPLIDPLTNRELDVLELLAERLQDKEIADKLCVSIATVKTHLRHIYEKLAVGNRRQAVQRARQSGLLLSKESSP
jgi:LuxR family maltose regulon positive regulatory protein